MHREIADRREDLAVLCRRFGVRRLEVSGSAARGTDFDPAHSDADFLVEFNRNFAPLAQYFDFQEAMQALLGRKVDLVESTTLRNPYLLASINRARELLFES
jgi:predicted nucleotidyltransferase